MPTRFALDLRQQALLTQGGMQSDYNVGQLEIGVLQYVVLRFY